MPGAGEAGHASTSDLVSPACLTEGVLAAVATVTWRAHAGAVSRHLTVRVATLGLLLVCLGGSLAPAQATSHDDRPVHVPTVEHGSCHMAGDGESLV